MTTSQIKQTTFFLLLLFASMISGCGVQYLAIRSKTPTQIATFRKSPIRMVALSSNERYLMTGQRIETPFKESGSVPVVQVLDLDPGSPQAKFSMEAAPNPTISGVFLDDGETVMTCSKAGLSQMRLNNGVVENILMPEQRAKIISPQGDAVACVTQQGEWGIYSPKKQSMICQFPENVEKVLAFSPIEYRVACAVKSGDSSRAGKTRIVFWSYETGTPEPGAGFEIDHYASDQSVFSNDGRNFATVRNSGTIGIWDVNTGRLRNSSTKIEGVVQSLAFSPDGTKLAIGTHGKYGKLSLWDIQTGEFEELFTERQAEGITAVCFNSSGELIYLGDSLGNVKRWNIASKHQQRIQ